MPALITHQLSFQLDSGEWLFRHLNLSLTKGISGFVGRNGAGKSVLMSLLLGRLEPAEGDIQRDGNIGHYSQLPSHLIDSDITIADFLGITDTLTASRAIAQGSTDPRYFNIIGDDWDIESQTEKQLTALGIQTHVDTRCRTLSGGQLALLQLHRLFSAEHDILLLDEPTNHLDAKGRQWLIEQLSCFEGIALVVSHDRTLLRHVDGIYQLTGLGLRYFSGNYEVFFSQTSLESSALDRQISQLKSEKKNIEKQAQINREKAQQRAAKGNRTLKSGSQPKILMDAKKDGAERSVSASNTNQQNQMKRNNGKLQSLEELKEKRKPQAMHLPVLTRGKNQTLVHVEGFTLPFGEQILLNFTVNQHDRCYLKGPNGCGKSTLLTTILKGYSPLPGEVRRNVSAVYLDQHFGLLDANVSMISSLMSHCEGLQESDARTLLAGIGFRRDTVYRQVSHLSGGEKMKLSMLMVSHTQHAQLLLLDEPDNHLDIEAKHVLAAALNAYKGAFILVSHDEDFVADVSVNKILHMYTD
ncbi:ABC-F family ATP-binding cassette domain-containing protein [Enterovibrio norvegicus]|uniref:Elongation factor 3 n=1 Tax=Enterovibrio norvegicus TaxID=188144 RepID=A0A2N7L7E9_9GAMM|nr:ATP-binding cassette domain-containing protein [Enterovibrio norvegicus]PMN89901.1 elongation factor 3 [Enterovibrio norvegicus]